MSKAAIVLSFSEDWISRLSRLRIYERWLTVREIPHTFIYIGSTDGMTPTAVIFDKAEDATAFKLKFGIHNV